MFAIYPVVVKEAGQQSVVTKGHYSRAQAEAFLANEGFDVVQGENAGWMFIVKGCQIEQYDLLEFKCPKSGELLMVDTITAVEWDNTAWKGATRYLLTFVESDARMYVRADKQYKIIAR